jgi:hypothetical protein
MCICENHVSLNETYGVRTAINNYEPVLQLGFAVGLFCRVLIEAKKRFDFKMRGLVLKGAWLSFYIKPADGLQFPEIMRWMMNISSLSRPSRSGSTS